MKKIKISLCIKYWLTTVPKEKAVFSPNVGDRFIKPDLKYLLKSMYDYHIGYIKESLLKAFLHRRIQSRG